MEVLGAEISMKQNNRRLADRVKQREESVRTRMLNIAAGRQDIIALGRGDPDLATPDHIVEARRKALASSSLRK